MKPLSLLLAFAAVASAQTTISISNTAIQTNIKPIGINLGTMTPYGSNQLYANLIATNPGFNDARYQSVVYCTTGTNANLCANGSNYGWSSGFWPLTGGTAVRVLTGVSAGCTTTLNSGGVNSFGFATTTACSSTAGISVGDYIELTKTIGSGTSGYNPAYGWVQSGSGSTYSFTHSTDAPPSSSTSTYSSSVEMAVTNGSDAAYLENLIDNQYLPWTSSTVSFINLNGNYSLTYWAKSVSGASPAAVVSFGRAANVPCVSACFVNFTSDALTGTWTKYTHNFTAAETGSQGSTLQLTIATTGLEDIRVANVAVTEQPTGGNTTVFRNAVVSTLQTLKPGSLRMWDQVGLTNTLSNMLVDQYARYPTSFSSYPQNAQGYYNSITYGLTDFLQLCNVVGAEPWISMPVNITPADASYLIDYLSGGSGTAGGAYRIAQGYSTAWTTVFAGKHIHLELGNEEWNGGTFEGGSMEYGPSSGTYQGYAVYGHYAQSIFAAMKATASYSSSVMTLTLSGFFEGPGSYTQQGQNGCNNNDEIDVGPYMDQTLTDASSTANIWQPALAEPQLFWQTSTQTGSTSICVEYTSGSLCPSGGFYNVGGVGTAVYAGPMYLNANAEANSTHPVALAIYEENNSSNQGNFSQANLNAYVSAWGQGLANASEWLTNMQNGVATQNVFELTEYYTTPIPNPNANGATYLFDWGNVVSMGGPQDAAGGSAGRRAQFVAQQVVDNAIYQGGSMLTTTQGGTNPTFVVGTSSTSTAVNTVATKSTGVNTIQSFAFTNGSGQYSLVLLNLDVASSQAVSYAGGIVPTGSITQTVLNSINLSDNNETSAVISPVTTTVGSAPTSLPAHSITTLTWGSSGPTAATYYVSNSGSDSNNGTSIGTPWQTITHVNATTRIPGDTVLFNGGQTFTGEIDSTVAGTVGNLITYSSYGIGKAIIDATGNNYGLNLTAPSYTTVQNIEVDNAAYYNVYANASASYSNFTITNVTSKSAGSNCIYLFNSAGAATSIVDTQNATSLCGGSGNKILTLDSGGTASRTGAIFTYNTDDHSSQAPSTTFADNGSTGSFYLVCPRNQACGNDTVAYNVSTNSGVGATVPGGFPVSSYGQGLWIDTATNVNVHDNSASTCGSIGIYLEKTINSTAYKNLAVNCATNGSGDFYAGISIAAGSSGIYGTYNSTGNVLLNNTSVTTGRAACSMNFESTSGVLMSNNVWQNNLCIGNSASTIYSMLMSASVNDGTHGSGNSLTHNGFGLTPLFYYAGTAYSTYSAFEAAFGATNSMTANPLLTAQNSLNATSPARQAGIVYTGYPSLCNTNPDIGAISYPCNLTTRAGGSLTLTSPTSVTWSLSGGGSLSTTSGTSTTYTAPTGLVPANQMLGCSVLPNDTVFNQRIDAAPVDPNSSTKIGNMIANNLNIQPSWGISYADGTTPATSLLTFYGEYSFSGFVLPNNPQYLKRESGNANGTFNWTQSPDHHIMTIRRTDCTFYESYDDYLSGYKRTCQDGITANCNVQSAVTYASPTYYLPQGVDNGTDAAGLLLAPLVWHLSEFKAGAIKHTVRFTESSGGFAYNSFIWPASSTAGGNAGLTPTTGLQLGDRLRLKASYTPGGTCSAVCTAAITALKNYGMILTDTGTSTAIQTADDVTEDPSVVQGLQQLTGLAIAPSQFEVINEQSLQTANSNSYQTVATTWSTPNNQVTISGGGSTVAVSVQPIAIGTTLQSSLIVEAGSYTVNFGNFVWVNPSTVSQTVNWTQTSSTCSGDSITSGGVYAVSSAGACAVVLTGTAAADSAATVVLNLTVIPTGASPANSVRIDTGSLSSSTDGNGNTWQADPGLEGMTLSPVLNDYPNWPTSNAYRVQLQSWAYSYANDVHYQMIVPNGNYQVHLMFGFGRTSQCGNDPCATWPTANIPLYPKTYNPLQIETNGNFVAHLYDWGYQSSYLYMQPADIYVPATVSNNLLEIGSMQFSPDSGPNYNGPNYSPSSGQKYGQVNAVEVLPDATSAYLTIDTATQTTIAASQNLQPVYPVSHYITSFNAASTVWTITGDPFGGSSVVTNSDGSATITAGSGSVFAGQPFIVKATNGSYSATAVLYTNGAKYIQP